MSTLPPPPTHTLKLFWSLDGSMSHSLPPFILHYFGREGGGKNYVGHCLFFVSELTFMCLKFFPDVLNFCNVKLNFLKTIMRHVIDLLRVLMGTFSFHFLQVHKVRVYILSYENFCIVTHKGKQNWGKSRQLFPFFKGFTATFTNTTRWNLYDFKVKGGGVFSGVKCEYLPLKWLNLHFIIYLLLY